MHFASAAISESFRSVLQTPTSAILPLYFWSASLPRCAIRIADIFVSSGVTETEAVPSKTPFTYIDLDVDDVNLAVKCHHVLVVIVVAPIAESVAFGVATKSALAFPDIRIRLNSFPNCPATAPPIPQMQFSDVAVGLTQADMVSGVTFTGALAQLKN
jgi:hypothetical protein